MSPAQRHRQRILAAELGRGGALRADGVVSRDAALTTARRPELSRAANEYELLYAKLGIDLRRLHSIQSREHKIAAKAEMLPVYVPWVKGLLAAEKETGTGVQDEILVQMMIWCIDCGLYQDALPLIAYVLKHKLALPERFKRTAATLIAEESADAALRALGQGENFDIGYLLEIDALTGAGDMIDQVRAKLMKAIGLLLAGEAANVEIDADGAAGLKGAAIDRGLSYLRRALELDGGCGVKTSIRDLERAQKKLSEGADK